jgi:hypothetical protein
MSSIAPSRATFIYCDNVSADYIFTNLVQQYHTEYVEIDLHFIHEHVAVGDVRALRAPIFADIFTKGLPSTVLSELRSSLNICPVYSCDYGGVSVLFIPVYSISAIGLAIYLGILMYPLPPIRVRVSIISNTNIS